MATSCSETQDCVFRNDFNETIGIGTCIESECHCSAFLGFSGPTCSAVSSQLRSLRALQIIAFIVFSYLLGRTCLLLYRYATIDIPVFYQGQKTDKERRTRNRIFVVLGLILFSQVCFYLFILFSLIGLYDATFVEVDEKSEEFVTVKPAKFAAATNVLSYATLILSLVAICLSWIELLEQLSDFSSSVTHMSRIRKVKLTLKYSLIFALLFLFLSTFTILRNYNIIMISMISFMVLLLILFGRRYLVKCLKEFNSEITAHTITIITRYAFYLGICAITNVINSIILSAISIRTRTEPNDKTVEFSPLIFFFLVVYNGLAGWFYYLIISYCSLIYQNLRRKLGKDTKQTLASVDTAAKSL